MKQFQTALFFTIALFGIGSGAEDLPARPAKLTSFTLSNVQNKFMTDQEYEKFRRLLSDVEKGQAKLTSLKKDYDEAQKIVDDNRCKTYVIVGEKKDDCETRLSNMRIKAKGLKEDYDRSKVQQNDLEEAYWINYNQKMKEIEAEKGRIEQAAKDQKTAKETALTARNSAIENNNLRKKQLEDSGNRAEKAFSMLKFSSLEFLHNIDEFNGAMRDLEKDVDETRLAAYLMMKMSKLLKSSHLCKSVASCQKDGVGADIPPNELKEIFTSLKDERKPRPKMSVPETGTN